MKFGSNGKLIIENVELGVGNEPGLLVKMKRLASSKPSETNNLVCRSFAKCIRLGGSDIIKETTVPIPKITISREELYDKVWSTPIHKLSKEFSLSDVGLGKLCRRHQIPVPGRGYWARLQSGQHLKRPPLPAIADARLNNIEIFPSEPRPPIRESEGGELQIPTILVAEDRALPHPHALRIERFILQTKTDEKGLALPN
jgi:hypothetical protein